MEEWYLHYAGHKQALELEPIYERHADLVTLERVQAVGAAADGRARPLLYRWASENWLTNLTKKQLERAAGLEAELEVEVDGERIPFRMISPAISQSPDPARRRRLYEAAADVREEHINPVLLEAARAHHAASARARLERLRRALRPRGVRARAARGACRELLDATERAWIDGVDRLLRSRAGVGLDQAGYWDFSRLLRAENWDAQFPAAAMLPALDGTLADLGIDLAAQANVAARRRAARAQVPASVLRADRGAGPRDARDQPIGGADDWRALFHEAGHTEHYANTSAGQTVEAKRMGDMAVTEGWAALFEGLLSEPAWIERRLDFARPREFAAESGVIDLFFARRYAAKLLYELEFYARRRPDPMRGRYVELLGDALKVEPAAATTWPTSTRAST